MPTFPPRTETTKKREQLLSRGEELRLALQRNVSNLMLAKAIKKYREAQLSYLKAQLHFIKEKEFQKKPHSLNQSKINSDIDKWMSITDEQIFQSFK